MADYPDFIQSTGYGEGWGLHGWNCRHSFGAYFDGISIPPDKEYLQALAERDAETKTYTTTWGTSRRDPDNPDKWLFRMGDKRVMELTYRDQLDIQRSMEREMRQTRRTAKVYEKAGLTTHKDESGKTVLGAFEAERARYKVQLREYSEFSRTMGIDEQRERIYADMIGRL